MSLTRPDAVLLATIVDSLTKARAANVSTAPPTALISLDDGYRAQEEWASQRSAAGERLAGYKIGLTSEAARSEFGAEAPGRGYLFRDDIHSSPAVVPRRPFSPRYEIELAVRLTDVLASTDSPAFVRDRLEVAPAIEVIATRWDPPAETVGMWAADNAMADLAILGEFVSAHRHLAERITVREEGRVMSVSTRSALRSLAWLLREREKVGQSLAPGTVVLTGAIIGPRQVIPGTTVDARIDGIGGVVAEFR